MATVTAALVKQLREMTDSPMMECKKALVEADGDIEKAVDVLRTMGMAKAVKKAGRETNEGTIGVSISDDSRSGALVEVTCETDFVGTNPKFTGFAKALAQVVAKNDPADVEALKACQFDEKDTVDSALTEMIHTMGENMKIARFSRLSVESGALSSYVHLGGKLGVIVEFAFSKPETAANDEFKAFAHDVAMQVAAATPICARREDVPADTIEHEKSIYKAQAADSGKPEAIQEKIAEGRLEKFYRESVLTEQVFIKDSETTISELAKKVGSTCGDTIQIMKFVRFTFGE
ncbi:MAG: translation elongation factor Ts [Atopobiaceae bacterium]|jgi:elongation factor Ts|nr:translation elongation factor Ts [Atopobiaceae bacterium]MCH4180038.1 translation elongation factor Ts [Atopobiaceae bacterium]MCH4213910.1 translation elongation factor Ts [Atopobiaceae bacterium]MCH4229840.1 translation elongation factor Ts [Atopobiaceae bacterium]MCH4275627.1 translation elongation factor Ts [Atopobiaceae bacterium]